MLDSEIENILPNISYGKIEDIAFQILQQRREKKQ